MRVSSHSTRHWLKAATVAISLMVGMPSQIRSSTVPKSGWGRMSHHTSRIELMARAEMSVVMNSSNSAQTENCWGRPAVGSASKTFDRLEARPVSLPIQYGLEADRARRWGR